MSTHRTVVLCVQASESGLTAIPADQTVLDLLPDIMYACDACNRHLQVGEPRFHCSRCLDYDLCSACHANAATQHSHSDGETQPQWTEVIVPSPPTVGPLADGASFAATISNDLVRFAERRCIGQRMQVDDPLSVTWLTYRELHQRIDACRVGLGRRILTAPAPASRTRFCHCRSQPRPHAAIWADNSVDWLVANLACHLLHCMVVPIGVSESDVLAATILQQMEVSVLFVDETTLARCANISPFPDTIRTVVLLHFNGHNASIGVGPVTACPSSVQPRLVRMEQLELDGRDGAPPALSFIEALPDCVVSVTYTSGSTGVNPKGVLITDRSHSYRTGQSMKAHDLRTAILLPLSNSTGGTQAIRSLSVGGVIGLVRRPSDFLADLAWIQPTVLSCPPKMWNALSAGFREDRRKLRHSSIPASAAGEPTSQPSAPANANADEEDTSESIALGRFRARLGGRVTSVSVGGAQSSTGLIAFLEKCFGSPKVNDSYGASECGSIARDGFVLPGVQVEILDVPELGFSASDQPWPRGELCVRTENMAAGYTSVAASEAAFIRMHDRVYYRTGDVVELRRARPHTGGHHYIRLLGRTSDVVKFSNGLFVSLESVEQVIEMRCHLVEHAFLHAVGGSDGLIAVLVSNSTATRWTEREWLEELRRLVQAEKLPSHCTPSRVIVDSSGHSWEQLGLLASQLKKRRPAILAHYKAQIEQVLATETDAAADSTQSVTATTLIQRVRSSILSHLNAPDVTFDQVANRSWTQAGGDSMTAIALAHSLHSLCPARAVTATQVLAAESLHQLLGTLLDDTRPGCPPSASSSVDWLSECSLPAGLVRSIDTCSTVSPQMLLTGAAGFLGSFLLAELLNRTECKVVCIVRAASDDAARSRIIRALVLYGLASSERKAEVLLTSRGAQIYAGDVASEHFDLPKERYQVLLRTVTTVLHNASRVNFVLPYTALRRDNVESTARILLFCCAAERSKALCYVSTASTESCTLDDLTHSAPSHTGYVLSKFVSEQLVRRAAQATGLAACIVRPTSIIGDSQHGFGPLDPSTDFISALWIGMAQVGRIHLRTPHSGLPPTTLDELIQQMRGCAGVPFQQIGLQNGFRLVPVDHAARNIVAQLVALCTARVPQPSSLSTPTITVTGARRISPLSLLLAADLPRSTPIICGLEAQREWRLLLMSDALPSILHPFRASLLHSTASDEFDRRQDNNDDSDNSTTIESNGIAEVRNLPADSNSDLAILRRCYGQLLARLSNRGDNDRLDLRPEGPSRRSSASQSSSTSRSAGRKTP